MSTCNSPFGFGTLIAAFSHGRRINPNFQRHAKLHGLGIEKNRRIDRTGFPNERARIVVAVPTIILTAACVIGFGWMLQKRTQVSGPLILLFCIGFCASACLNCIAAFLLDIYPGRAGTVAASNSLLRCFLRAGATAATVHMIDDVEIGWTLIIYRSLNAVFMPLLWYIMREGPGWRDQRSAAISK